MRPLVESALSEAGAVQVYNQTMGEYDSIPFMPDVKADITAPRHWLSGGSWQPDSLAVRNFGNLFDLV